MTEEHTPETKPHPTHVIEVYLHDADRLMGAGRMERYFFESENAAEGVYAALVPELENALARDNRAPATLEVHDLYGKGTLVVRDLRGVRLFASADLDAFDLTREVKRAGAVAEAKHRATEARP